MLVPLDFMSELFSFIANGAIMGIPTLVVMAIPLIVGIILGFLVKKFLKWAIIIGVIVLVLAYFGVWGLSFDSLHSWAANYGDLAIQGAILLIGVLPLGIGFAIGLILGFIFG